MACGICGSPDHDRRVHRFGKRGAPKRTNADFARVKGVLRVVKIPAANSLARRDSSGHLIESLGGA